MRITSAFSTVLACAIVMIFSEGVSAQDILLKRSGEKVHGRILRRYSDRIKIMTVFGKQWIPVEDLDNILKQGWADELLLEADRAFDRAEYYRAWMKYRYLSKMMPEMTVARERDFFLARFIDKKTAMSGFQYYVPFSGRRRLNGQDFDLHRACANVKVTYHEPHHERLLSDGDILIEIDNSPTSAMRLVDVARAVGEPAERVFKVERSATFNAGRAEDESPEQGVFGAVVRILREGLMVRRVFHSGSFWEAGLQKGDLLISVDGADLRHVDLRGFLASIPSLEEGRMYEVVFRRVLHCDE